MRTGRLPISGPCGCNLCLVIGRLAAFCHSGDLGPAPVAFATDRLRVLYNELLDIWARGPALGPLVQPPPVAAGGGPGASTEPTAPPPKGGSPPDTPVPEGAKVEVQPEERDRTISPATTRATPAVAPEKNPFSSPPPAPGAGDPDQSFDSASVKGSVSKAPGAPPVEAPVPVKAAPRRPPSLLESSSHTLPVTTVTSRESTAKTEAESDEYTYETEENETAPAGSSATAPEVEEERTKKEPSEDQEKPNSKNKEKKRSKSRRRSRREEEEDRREKKRSRSRKRERRTSREDTRRSSSRRARRGSERPRSPAGPPPAPSPLASGHKGSGKGYIPKKSKGVVRANRWQDIQAFGPNPRRKKKREEEQRR